jgi:hypothetical protein
MNDSYVVEISRSLHGGGLLLIVELVYYVVVLAYTVWKWFRNRRVAVTEYRRQWRCYRRERWERVNDRREMPSG